MRRQDIRSDAGFSLVEILVTIVIVGMTFTAILGGILASITASGLQRKQATADSLVRSAAELVKDSVSNPYSNCAGTGKYVLTGLSVPTGYSVSVTGVKYWSGNPQQLKPVPFNSSCPSDNGMQQITIVATSSDGQAAETVQVVKRRVP
jgi:prepilin-type N-terminal cleavage/methylation domain-containing protein